MARKGTPLQGGSELWRPDGTTAPVCGLDGARRIGEEEWAACRETIARHIGEEAARLLSGGLACGAVFGEMQPDGGACLLELMRRAAETELAPPEEPP